MDFARSRAVASRLDVLNEVPSTNDELVARLHAPGSDALPEFTVVVTTNQTAGRGRLGREEPRLDRFAFRERQAGRAPGRCHAG